MPLSREESSLVLHRYLNGHNISPYKITENRTNHRPDGTFTTYVFQNYDGKTNTVAYKVDSLNALKANLKTSWQRKYKQNALSHAWNTHVRERAAQNKEDSEKVIEAILVAIQKGNINKGRAVSALTSKHNYIAKRINLVHWSMHHPV